MINEKVKDYVEFIKSFDAKRLALLGKYYARDCHIYDPLAEIRGLDDLRAMCKRLQPYLEKFKIVHHAYSKSKNVLLVRWDLKISVKGKILVLSGASEVTFMGSGLILHQANYWDSKEYFKITKPLRSSLL